MMAGIVAGGRPLIATPPSMTDPHWASVMLLINGESGYSDLSSNAHPTTPGAYALLDTTTKKFGAASIGCGDYSRRDILTVPSTPAALLTGDYTIEFWLHMSAITDSAVLWRANVNHSVTVDPYGVLSVYADNWPHPSVNLNHQTAIPLNEWAHVAVVKSTGVIYAYVNGVQSTASATESEVRNSADGSIISIPGSVRIDDYRITKGVARYNGSFTPPSAAFPTS